MYDTDLPKHYAECEDQSDGYCICIDIKERLMDIETDNQIEFLRNN